MWAEKWTIMQEASGSSTVPNAARRISCHDDIVKAKLKGIEQHIINLRGLKNQLLHNKPNLNRFKTTPDTSGCLHVSGGASGWFGYYIRLDTAG